MSEQDVLFFPCQEDFRKWLAENHQEQTEQWLGYYKKATGKASITWPESVDEALCFGWIDGLRKRIDDEAYKIRFTPRKVRSHWSEVNIKRIEELKKSGLVQPAGLDAYTKKTEKNSGLASHEQGKIAMPKPYERQIKDNKAAWKYYSNLAPSTRKQYIWWVISAKREETRLKRLNTVIECSSEGELIPPLKWSSSAKKK